MLRLIAVSVCMLLALVASSLAIVELGHALRGSYGAVIALGVTVLVASAALLAAHRLLDAARGVSQQVGQSATRASIVTREALEGTDGDPSRVLTQLFTQLLACVVFGIGLLAPLTPSTGDPTTEAWLVFLGGPLALVSFAAWRAHRAAWRVTAALLGAVFTVAALWLAHAIA